MAAELAKLAEEVQEEAQKKEIVLPPGWSLDDPDETRRKKAIFLAALLNRPRGKPPNIGLAARCAGITRATAYRWRESDPEFAEIWDESKEAALDNLEEVVYGMGFDDKTPVAAFAYLKAHRENWRDKYQSDVNFNASGAINIQITVAPRVESDKNNS